MEPHGGDGDVFYFAFPSNKLANTPWSILVKIDF